MAWIGPALARQVTSGRLGIAITGAGSWLGQALLSLLLDEGALSDTSRVRLFGSSPKILEVGAHRFDIESLSDAAPLGRGAWMLFHFAFLGKERVADMPLASYLAANEAIFQDTLHLADSVDDLRLVFASSGAVYASDRQTIGNVEASPYGWCKIAQEAMFADWCRGRDVPLIMPRIFNIGGPFINKTGSYALSSFIMSARRSGLIRIEARRPTWRSYVHVDELLSVLCEAALAQTAGAPMIFDTAGAISVEMADLAACVAATMPQRIRIERPALSVDDPDRYLGDGAFYRRMIERRGDAMIGLEQIVTDTKAFLEPRP